LDQWVYSRIRWGSERESERWGHWGGRGAGGGAGGEGKEEFN